MVSEDEIKSIVERKQKLDEAKDKVKMSLGLLPDKLKERLKEIEVLPLKYDDDTQERIDMFKANMNAMIAGSLNEGDLAIASVCLSIIRGFRLLFEPHTVTEEERAKDMYIAKLCKMMVEESPDICDADHDFYEQLVTKGKLGQMKKVDEVNETIKEEMNKKDEDEVDWDMMYR